jgi:hypothetical protein
VALTNIRRRRTVASTRMVKMGLVEEGEGLIGARDLDAGIHEGGGLAPQEVPRDMLDIPLRGRRHRQGVNTEADADGREPGLGRHLTAQADGEATPGRAGIYTVPASGGTPTVVIQHRTSRPGGLVLDVPDGFVSWTECKPSLTPSFLRARVDGSEVTTLSTELGTAFGLARVR